MSFCILASHYCADSLSWRNFCFKLLSQLYHDLGSGIIQYVKENSLAQGMDESPSRELQLTDNLLTRQYRITYKLSTDVSDLYAAGLRRPISLALLKFS